MITKKSVVFTTPWFKIVAKTVGTDANPYYSLQTLDYVCVIAITRDGKLILVRQYRPAVEFHTLELPAGHVELGETPEAAARRELLEETGFSAERFELLGQIPADTGRYENKQWCFFAENATGPAESFKAEDGVEVVHAPSSNLAHMIRKTELSCALHFAALCLFLVSHREYLDRGAETSHGH